MPCPVFVLSWIAAICAIISAATGLIWQRSLDLPVLTNVHGHMVTSFGQGLYARESQFIGPIYLATDAVMLGVVIPLFLGTTVLGARGGLRAVFVHTGLATMLFYYAASIPFGTAYNELFPLYILLFSSSLFCLIACLAHLSRWHPGAAHFAALPRRGLMIFLCAAGLSVLVWLTEVIPASMAGTAPDLLGMSSTSVTFLLDIGIIAPTCFLAAFLVWTGRPFGSVLAVALLICNALMGILVIAQTLFQRAYGVEVATSDLILFVGVFIAMSITASVLLVLTLRSIPRGARP